VWLWLLAVAGTLLGIGGAIVWFSTTVASGLNCGLHEQVGRDELGVRVGFAVMILGPLAGWIAIPVGVAWGRRRWYVAWPILIGCAGLAVIVVGAALSSASICSSGVGP